MFIDEPPEDVATWPLKNKAMTSAENGMSTEWQSYGQSKALDTTELAKIVRAYHTMVDLTEIFSKDKGWKRAYKRAQNDTTGAPASKSLTRRWCSAVDVL